MAAELTTEESLEKAYKHVSSGWLPPQEEVLSKIKERLESGEYARNRQQLTYDLKEDFSLYMYCLKELSLMIQQANQANEWTPAKYQESTFLKQTPVQILENAELEDFRRILDKPAKELSKHSFSEITALQALRFREALLSATTAEVLSESVSVDPEFGYSCAMLRQLGLCLIAWNYPRVYARALETLSAEVSLDASIRKVLGFSPALLGLRFAQEWNLSNDVISVMETRRSRVSQNPAFAGNKPAEDLQSENLGATLAKICEVGEALARASDPEHYPNALDDWQTAQQVIAVQLGPQGIEEIYSRAKKNLSCYLKHAPELLSFEKTNDVEELIVDSQYSSKLLEKNSYLKHLPEDLRKEIRELYSRFKPNKILKANIRLLMNEIIPRAGFRCGCVYMYDPETKTLSPAIKTGEVPRIRLRPVKISSVLAQFDVIASAFSLKTPLREETISEEDTPLTVLAAALGQTNKVGVLYLETRADFNSTIDADSMAVFRAIRQCFHDCLNLS